MPGAVARTATLALTQATLPYVTRIADLGWRAACRQDAGLCNGLQIADGQITYKALADDLGKPYLPPEKVISG